MNKEKGFTLIEIIVSLMIASIAMVIASTLILNSMGYFNKTAVSDNDKQVLDSIKDYVYNELLYASNVKIQTEYPSKEDGTRDEGWHYLFVKDHQLYRDQECDTDFTKAVPVYGDDFYTNGRKLFIQTRGFNSYRIDFKLYLTDRTGSEASFEKTYVYRTSTTIELLNMKEYISLKGGKGIFEQAKLESISDETASKLKVFYKKEALEINEPTNTYIGFVSDQIGCKTDANTYNGTGKLELNKQYKAGTFVYVEDEKKNKIWYRCLKDASVSNYGEVTADSSYRWKKIDAFFDKYSPYLTGDRVVYVVGGVEKYFECIKNTLDRGTVILPSGSYNSDQFWKEIDKPTTPNKLCDVPGMVEYKGIVATKPEDQGINRDNIEAYDKTSGIGNERIFVKDQYGNIWLKLKSGYGNITPGSRDKKDGYIWQKIQLNWDETSGYIPGDIVYFQDDFYRVQSNFEFYDGSMPAYNEWGNWKPSNGWEKVYFKNDGSWQTWN